MKLKSVFFIDGDGYIQLDKDSMIKFVLNNQDILKSKCEEGEWDESNWTEEELTKAAIELWERYPDLADSWGIGKNSKIKDIDDDVVLEQYLDILSDIG